MYLHVDKKRFSVKPSGMEIAGIKKSFAQKSSIVDISVGKLAEYIESGCTVQPGVTPFSEKSRAEGKTGTNHQDFRCQQVFMIDIDNANHCIQPETPSHAVEVLGGMGLPVAFAYPTYGFLPDFIYLTLVSVSDG